MAYWSGTPLLDIAAPLLVPRRCCSQCRASPVVAAMPFSLSLSLLPSLSISLALSIFLSLSLVLKSSLGGSGGGPATEATKEAAFSPSRPPDPAGGEAVGWEAGRRPGAGRWPRLPLLQIMPMERRRSGTPAG